MQNMDFLAWNPSIRCFHYPRRPAEFLVAFRNNCIGAVSLTVRPPPENKRLAGHNLIARHRAASACRQYPLVTAFACSLRREGRPMFMWEASNDVPTVLALMAAICLWGFVASAATIYSSRLAHWI
jgi:hypothetical protein